MSLAVIFLTKNTGTAIQITIASNLVCKLHKRMSRANERTQSTMLITNNERAPVMSYANIVSHREI